MKTRHPLTARISLLSLGLLLAAGTAGAQTITQTYANSGVADGNLASIGFDSYLISQVTGTTNGGSIVSATGGSAFGTNWTAINYIFDTPTAPAGYDLTAAELSIYIIGLTPGNTSTAFDIYSGLDRTGGVIGSFVLTEPASEGGFADISIPISALSGGFSIGYATNSTNPPTFTSYTEDYGDAAYHPSMTFTFTEVVPEPSVALLGAVGVLAALRRRREVSI